MTKCIEGYSNSTSRRAFAADRLLAGRKAKAMLDVAWCWIDRHAHWQRPDSWDERMVDDWVVVGVYGGLKCLVVACFTGS